MIKLANATVCWRSAGLGILCVAKSGRRAIVNPYKFDLKRKYLRSL